LFQSIESWLKLDDFVISFASSTNEIFSCRDDKKHVQSIPKAMYKYKRHYSFAKFTMIQRMTNQPQ